MEPTLLIDARLQNAEGPVWDERTGRLYFVGLPEGEVHAYELEGGTHRVYALGRKAGAVLLCESGRLLVALADGLFFLDPESGALQFIADPEAGLPGNRFNDCKCDGRGRAYLGTMSDDEGVAGQGSLYRLDPDGRVHTMVRGVSISNGLEVDWEERGLYYIDSPTRRVDRFDYDAAAGALSARRAFVDTAQWPGVPDGMTLDAAGDLWVAMWGGSCLRMFDGVTGALKRQVALPAERVSSCCFGGPGYRTLFVTTARSDAENPAQPHAGGVFCFTPEVGGRAPGRFDDRAL